MDIEKLQTRMNDQLKGHSLFEKSKQYAVVYMETIDDRRVFPDDNSLAGLDTFNEPIRRNSLEL